MDKYYSMRLKFYLNGSNEYKVITHYTIADNIYVIYNERNAFHLFVVKNMFEGERLKYEYE